MTRREVYTTMLQFEEQGDVHTAADQLEDITSLIFDTVGKLEGTQMLCKDNLDLFETMSCFEVMDPKMDARMVRKDVTTPKSLRAAPELTPTERQSLVQELLLQFATW